MATCHPDKPHYGKGLCLACYKKLVRKEHPNSARQNRLSKYGLTIEEYNEILEEQGGVCAICGRPPKTRSLDVDHEHQLRESSRTPESRKQRIRGLLCHRCNRALGLLGNKPEDLLFVAGNLNKYIEKYYAKVLYNKDGSDAIIKADSIKNYLLEYEKARQGD